MSSISYKSLRQKAFTHYLRTGQRLPEESFVQQADVELKFNPYHDPRNGQFTFAPGHPHSSGGVIVSNRQGTQANRRGTDRNVPRHTVTVPDRPTDQTSFGPLNIQERRAAQILGYGDISKMSETARRTLVPTTKDPTAAIFMAAQHLSDLRDMEFRGASAKDLTKDQMLIIATRYNQGSEKSLEEIKFPESIKHGYDYLRNWNIVGNLLN